MPSGLGYDEGSRPQTGSHKLILGTGQSQTSCGGILGGVSNPLGGPDAAVFGFGNVASGGAATVTGGAFNTASSSVASVSGGYSGSASGGRRGGKGFERGVGIGQRAHVDDLT